MRSGSSASYRARGETPAVYALLSVMCIVFLVDWLMHDVLSALLLWPVSPAWFGWPLLIWQPFTFPFAHGSAFMAFLTDAIVLFFFGRTLESAWGSGRFLFFFFACGIITGLTVMALSPWLHIFPVFAGMLGTFAGLVVAFAALDPYATVLFNLIIPIQARWLAVFSIAWEIFGRTQTYGGPIPAVVAVGVTSAFAYLFATRRLSLSALFGRGGPTWRERVARWRQKRQWRQWQRRVSRIERPEDLFKDKR